MVNILGVDRQLNVKLTNAYLMKIGWCSSRVVWNNRINVDRIMIIKSRKGSESLGRYSEITGCSFNVNSSKK